jgi:NhaP-type Na+/H+ or K+/H+ antiporter
VSPSLLATIALALLTFGAISRRAQRGILTAPMVFVVLGFGLGADGLGWLTRASAGSFLDGLAELTLAIVLFTDASRIDLTCLRREENLPLRLLGIGLPLAIGLGALVAQAIWPELPGLECALLAAILAPTDAALGQAVVSDTRVPVRIRQTLNVESGLNDGIVLPAVLVLASLASAIGEPSADVREWLRFAALQVTLGPLVGVGVGVLGGQLITRASRAGWIEESFQRLAGVALAVLAFALADLVHGNGFIAAFSAGLALGSSSQSICPRLHAFGEAEGQLLTLLVFLLFGAVLLPSGLREADAAVWGYAALSLTLIRMLPVAVALWGSGLRPVSFAFLGWFGPRGLASILFALIVSERFDVVHAEWIEAVVGVTVLLSVFAHGASAYPFASRYAQHVGARAQHMRAEHVPVTERPVRMPHRPAPTSRSRV